jgi:hypothetical protein
MKKSFLLFSVFLFGSSYVALNAQETVPASGSNASGTGGSVSYTIGQTDYTQYTTAGGSVALGVQIPYEITVITAVSPLPNLSLTCTAYPNPASAALNLKMGTTPSDQLYYILTDAEGKVLEKKRVTEIETSISLGQYPNALYLLSIYEFDKKIESFRILHTN